MKKIFSFLLVIILCSSVFAKNNYESKTFERDENKILEFDKFYLAHYFIFDVLIALNIYDEVSLEEKKNIINDLHKHLSNSYQKEITFTTIKPINLIIFMKPFKVGNDMSIFMLTNYDVDTMKIVPYKSKDTVYVKQYFICETKLIPRKEYQNRNKSKSVINNYIKEKDYNSLGNFLLYDDSLENDSKTITYLNEGLKNNPSFIDKAYLNLTIMEYCLFIEDYKKYEETYKLVSNDLKNAKDKKEKKLIEQELKIMNDLKYILE